MLLMYGFCVIFVSFLVTFHSFLVIFHSFLCHFVSFFIHFSLIFSTFSHFSHSSPLLSDNTNPSEDLRALYISLARSLNIPTRCFHFQATEDQARHMNIYRELVSNGVRKRVPALAYASYKSRFQRPQVSEGFKEIKLINFVPEFKSEGEKKLFMQYLL